MSGEAAASASPPAPAPLSSGPIPLTLPASFAWSGLILAGTLFLGLGLPLIAAGISRTSVPPGAVAFGVGSVVPAPGWAVTDRTDTTVVLENRGVVITFASSLSADNPAPVRLRPLQEALRQEAPQLTISTDPSPFVTDQGLVGSLSALAGTSQTALAAAVVGFGHAVDVTAIGASTPFGDAISDIEDMLRSIRIAADDDG